MVIDQQMNSNFYKARIDAGTRVYVENSKLERIQRRTSIVTAVDVKKLSTSTYFHVSWKSGGQTLSAIVAQANIYLNTTLRKSS